MKWYARTMLVDHDFLPEVMKGTSEDRHAAEGAVQTMTSLMQMRWSKDMPQLNATGLPPRYLHTRRMQREIRKAIRFEWNDLVAADAYRQLSRDFVPEPVQK